jgi:hypothetical protein
MTVHTIDPPSRFQKSHDVGAHLGLTPRRYQSGGPDQPPTSWSSAPCSTIVCRNEAEAAKDASDRAAVIAALDQQLRRGDKAPRIICIRSGR